MTVLNSNGDTDVVRQDPDILTADAAIAVADIDRFIATLEVAVVIPATTKRSPLRASSPAFGRLFRLLAYSFTTIVRPTIRPCRRGVPKPSCVPGPGLEKAMWFGACLPTSKPTSM